jgi:hypothetical protein
VVDRSTDCTRCTVLIQARINAVPVPARLVQRALRIRVTSLRDAPDPRVTFVTLRAPAVGNVVRRVALGREVAAVLHDARVLAVAVEAGLVKRAVAVSLAPS